MTNSSSNTPPEPSPESDINALGRLMRWLRRPSTIAFGIAGLTIGGVGYVGVQLWLYQNLPTLIETELSKLLQREVRVGEVERLSLTSINLGSTSIPPTPTDPDTVSLESIKVDWNPLPLIAGHPLSLKLTLVEVDGYVDEAERGKWVNFEQAKEELESPIPLDMDINFSDTQITILPYGVTTPLTVQLEGKVNFLAAENRPQRLKYDVAADIATGKVRINGETLSETGKTKALARVQDLPLPVIASLLPDFPIKVKDGQLHANLNIELPEFNQLPTNLQEISAKKLPQVWGVVGLQNIEVATEQLDDVLKAQALLRFQGQKVSIEDTQGSYGKITALVSGTVDSKTGLDVGVELQPLSLPNLFQTISVQLPINIAGEIAAKLAIKGSFAQPKLTGTVKNTKITRIDKVEFSQIKADFVANLSEFQLIGLSVKPLAGGQFKTRGKVKTKQGFIEYFQAKASAAAQEKPLPKEQQLQLALDFATSLPVDALLAKYPGLPAETTIGTLTSQGKLQGTLENPSAQLTWKIPAARSLVPSFVGLTQSTTPLSLAGTGELILSNQKLRILNTKLQLGEGTVAVTGTGNLQTWNWQTSLQATSILLDPFLPVSGQLESGTIDASGKLNDLNLTNITASADLELAVVGGRVNSSANLQAGTLTAEGKATDIELSKFVPQLPVAVALQEGNATVATSVEQLLAVRSVADLGNLNATFAGLLGVDGGRVDATGELNAGTLVAEANASSIQLNNLLQLPIPLALQGGNLELSGAVEQLLAFNQQRDLSSFNATFTGQIEGADGTAKVRGNLTNGQWQTKIAAANINTLEVLYQLGVAPESLLAAFKPEQLTLDAKLDLAGAIQPLLQLNPTPIQANQLVVQLGEQFLDARGSILLSPLTNTPEVVNLDLNIRKFSYDADALPVSQLITQVLAQQSLNQQFLPREIQIAGRGNFQGKLQGSNLLSAPFAPGNLNLVGNLQLRDLAINELVFNPLLAGEVKVDTGKAVTVDLRGTTDVITASLESCTSRRCQFPYLPTSLELRQGVGENAVIATGRRRGEVLDVYVEAFPLALLNIAPGVQVGISSPVAGEVTGELDINLFTLATAGRVEIQQPTLGYLQAENFQGGFSYRDGIAKLTEASLVLGKSLYNIEAGLNLNSGALNGKIAIAQGYVQDLLSTVGWFDFQDLARGIKTPEGKAEDLQPLLRVGSPSASLAERLKLLEEIEQQLQQLAASARKPGIPSQLDIQGGYTGEITLAGSLEQPQVNFNLQGKDWLWYPQPDYSQLEEPVVVEVAENSGATDAIPGEAENSLSIASPLSIEQVIAKGSIDVNRGLLNLEPVQVEVEGALLSYQGQLSLAQETGVFFVKNLSLDTLRHFVTIPDNIQGNLNASGSFGGSLVGSLATLQIQEGEISLEDATVNRQPLADIKTQFSYANSTLDFNTTQPSNLQAQGQIPFPIVPGTNDRFSLDAKLGTDAIALIGLFTQGLVEWEQGDTELELQAKGSLALNQRLQLQDLVATGGIRFDEATFTSQQFPEKLSLNGKVELRNQRITVEQLTGNLAESKFTVAGVLPLLEPISTNDPDSSNPLTIAIAPGQINLAGLYKGDIEGEVILTGTAIRQPEIGGKLQLEHGQVFIPEFITNPQGTKDTILASSTSEISNQGNNNSPFPGLALTPRFKDFQLILGDGLKIKPLPVAQFHFAGDLTLNGPLLEPEKLAPEGTIQLRRGYVELFDNEFYVTRNPEVRQEITFNPNRGLLNPTIDIQLGAVVLDPSGSQDFLEVENFGNRNEIRDTSQLAFARPQQIKVNLNIKGEGKQLLALLALDEGHNSCQITENSIDATIEGDSYYSPAELQQLSSCLQYSYLGEQANLQLLNSSLVTLTSIPSLSETEITALLGKNFLSTLQGIQQTTEEGDIVNELLGFAVTRFVVEPLLREVTFVFEESVSSVGKSIGLSDFRVLPIAEGIYQVGEDAFVGVSYDYFFNEVKVRYEVRF